MKKLRIAISLLINNQLFTKADTCTISRLIPTQKRSDSQQELDLFCYISVHKRQYFSKSISAWLTFYSSHQEEYALSQAYWAVSCLSFPGRLYLTSACYCFTLRIDRNFLPPSYSCGCCWLWWCKCWITSLLLQEVNLAVEPNGEVGDA